MIEAKFPPFNPRISESYRAYEEHMKGLTWDKDKGEGGGWVRKPPVHKPAMPEVDIRRAEKLAEINLGEPASEPRKTLRELLGDGEWDSYKMFPDGSVVDAGKSKVEWLDDSTPRWHPVDMDKVDEMIKAWKGRVEEATHTENWELWGASVIDSPEVRQAQVDLNAVCRDTIQAALGRYACVDVPRGIHRLSCGYGTWLPLSPQEEGRLD
jgi:hypothetical protein